MNLLDTKIKQLTNDIHSLLKQSEQIRLELQNKESSLHTLQLEQLKLNGFCEVEALYPEILRLNGHTLMDSYFCLVHQCCHNHCPITHSLIQYSSLSEEVTCPYTFDMHR